MKSHIFLFAGLSMLATACHGPERAAGGAAHPGPSPLAVGRGVIDSDPGVIVITAPSEGIVRAVDANEGDAMPAGAILVRLDDRQARLALGVSASEIAELEARVQAAATRVRTAAVEAARLQRLADADAGTRQDAEQAQSVLAGARDDLRIAQGSAQSAQSRRRLDIYALQARLVTAPVAGRIVRRTATQGAWVAAGAPLFEVEPQGARVVRAELDEAYADRLRPGMTATISLESNPGRTFPARVERVSERFGGSTIAGDPTAPSDTRNLGVLLSLPAGGVAGLRLGQRVLVRVAK
ncbi:HlyD family secretion protein [soil metagenome]